VVMHVYADANIFLDFFRFSDDDLGELQKFADHLQGDNLILYLPQLTAEEYFRNRDKVVIDQLAELKRPPLKVGIPIFVRELAQAKEFQKSLEDALAARGKLLSEVEKVARDRTFRADQLMNSIFQKAIRLETAPYLVERAQQRLSLGNPPGKSGSLGDRLNWECLLAHIPEDNDLYLLTRDGDFLTSFPTLSPSMFLCNEWSERKRGVIHHFKGIKPFANYVDESLVFQPDITPPFVVDAERTDAINSLACSFNYAQTHAAVANLSPYIEKFSPAEMEDILEAALSNGQVGGIMGDDDVSEFYTAIRSRMPWGGNAVADKFDEAFGMMSEPPF
jgi:PIN domain